MMSISDVLAAFHLYSPQQRMWDGKVVDVRGDVNWASNWVARLLRRGQHQDAADILNDHNRMHGLDVTAPVLGYQELHRIPWSTIPAGTVGRTDVMIVTSEAAKAKDTTIGWLDHMVEELEMRGARVQVVSYAQLSYANRFTVDGRVRAIPDAVVGAWMAKPHTPVLDKLAKQGAFVVNSAEAVRIGRDKNLMAHAFQKAGISMPKTCTNVKTVTQLHEALQKIGGTGPFVLKKPHAELGEGVVVVQSVDEAEKALKGWIKDFGGAARVSKMGGFVVQEFVDAGSRDMRVHFGRDAVTGEMRLMGATDRVALGGDFRANGGIEGNAIRPIYDLSGNDSSLDHATIDMARRAIESAGLDWGAVDIGRRVSDGSPIVFEVDNYSHPLEINHPVPIEQQTFRRLADLLVYWNGERPGQPAATT